MSHAQGASTEELLSIGGSIQSLAFAEQTSGQEAYNALNSLLVEHDESTVPGQAAKCLQDASAEKSEQCMASIRESYAAIEALIDDVSSEDPQMIPDNAQAVLDKIMNAPPFHTISLERLVKLKERTEKAKAKLGTAYRDQAQFVEFCNLTDRWIVFHQRLPALGLALAAYQAELDSAESQLSSLGSSLIAYDGGTDEDLLDIADDSLDVLFEHYPEDISDNSTDFLSGLTENAMTNLTNLQRSANEFKSFLASSAQVAACESNPFGVQVSFVNSLSAALDQITSA